MQPALGCPQAPRAILLRTWREECVDSRKLLSSAHLIVQLNYELLDFSGLYDSAGQLVVGRVNEVGTLVT